MKKICLLPIFGFMYLLAFSQLQQEWVFKTNGRIYSSPALVSGLIMFGSNDSCFYALDQISGKLKWKYKTNGIINTDPATDSNLVYFASSGGNLYALYYKTRQLAWNINTGKEKALDIWDYYLSSPVLSNNVIYKGCSNGRIIAVNAADGSILWQFQASDMIHATPVVNGDRLYAGDFSGYFYAIETSTGNLVWKMRTIGETWFPKGEIQKAAAFSNGVLFFGSRDYNMYAIDAQTGRGKWNMKEQGSWIIATPLVHNGLVYAGTSDSHRFICLSAADGSLKWEIKLPMRVYGSAIYYDGLVWFGCFDGILRGVDPETGEVITRFSTLASKLNYFSVFDDSGKFRKDFELYGKNYLESESAIHNLGSILTTPVADGHHIYFGSSDGNLYSVKIR
jgi:outer membrane protein assembly factor BamB